TNMQNVTYIQPRVVYRTHNRTSRATPSNTVHNLHPNPGPPLGRRTRALLTNPARGPCALGHTTPMFAAPTLVSPSRMCS
ncbi:hypothetical protein B0H10DRAFT_2027813, partial [Mycena sp. CBHHK59/15]